MNLLKATVFIPDDVVCQLSEKAITNLCDNAQEYIEEAIEDLACVHWDKELKVTFE
jgi:hypothetical protein